MVEHRVGSLVVVDDEDDLVGIITERDYLKKVIVAGKASKTTLVSEVMSTDLACAEPDFTIDECMALMLEKNCRHLPVVQNDELVGVISMKDIVATIQTTYQRHIEHLTGRSGAFPTRLPPPPPRPPDSPLKSLIMSQDGIGCVC
eukprot:CAMPEP_0184336910 /NCGR_PEP_ID=MMETSP1089-20130417/5168_1 /TAXON_ID=38269 ORGANISM="Gloeochaete wittrockiana, Strain SAG46.84" /NCGR_SAMPLE_ID=MMETSP1089 /ASSEMBLY_ACC=CAM_ASM_000445 /LENGTH=144 /DNA_ID=CAMNT_0026662167 /DNA_START=354 /DNA_END=786 /DNA_ORIENTATION=-